MALIHGGDIAGFTAEYGYPPLDFSANVSPLGLSEGARQAIVQSLDTADTYPDPLCRPLTEALAVHEGAEPRHILCGSGAADLIFRLCYGLRPKTALVLAPTFAEYELALRAAGCEVRHHLLCREEGFALTSALLSEIQPGLDLLFLCQPNNPTGQLCPPSLLAEIAARCAQTGTLLVTDECFVDFLDEPEAASAKALLPGGKLLILKAFTKLYAMAGLRLGYCLSTDAALLSAMREAGQPWAVSTPAMAAGLAALEDEDYLFRLRTLVREERRFLAEGLRRLGLSEISGSANFLFFHTDCHDLVPNLRKKGILIRDCANYRGLAPGDCRIAVRSRMENLRLLTAMEAVLQACETTSSHP